MAATAQRTKKVIADFPVALCHEADEVASEMNISRSGVIRRAVEALVKARQRARIQAEIDQYFAEHADHERSIMQDFQYVDADHA